MNVAAYERKIVERHSFRLLFPEDANVYTGGNQEGKAAPTIIWGGTLGNSIQKIQQQYDYNGTTTQVSYKSWLYNEDRFLCEPTSNPTAYALDFTGLSAGAIPQGWRCVQENDEVHESPNTYTLGSRVLDGFRDSKMALYWRVGLVEYGNQNAFPLPLYRGSYTLSFKMARRGTTGSGFTVRVIKKTNNGENTVQTQSYESGDVSTVTANPSENDLNDISEKTLTFSVEEAGNYIIRFTTSDVNDNGYVLASCQLTRNGDSWQITKNARTDKGYGLVNVSGSYKGLKILNLKKGDVVRFSYFLNSTESTAPKPLFKASDGCITGRHQSWSNSGVVTLVDGAVINGSFDIFVDSDGDLDINCPSGILIREVTITLAEYKRANYKIEPVAGTPGYKYTITGPGVLEEKRGAVPYITMRFGNDNDMTIVKDFGNGNYAASCIVDSTNDLDIEHSNVRLNAIYKRRYQNASGQFVAFTEPLTEDTENPANSTYNQVGDQTEQNRVKALAKEEVNSLKGREWTIFEATNNWDNGANWINARSRCYKWGDNFNSIYPLYGTYFYFFPEVKGKLSLKFYCEGGGEHMAFWYKQDRNGNFIPVGNGQPNNGHNNTLNTNIYEYNDIQLERGGVYYLCANPTLIAREHPVVRLISYQFIPEFVVEPLYKVVENGTENVSTACTIKGGVFNDLTVDKDRKIMVNGEEHPEVKFLGNIEGADFTITHGNEENYLNISNITYKTGANMNKGGAICVNLHCDAGEATFVLTVAYKAAEARMTSDGRTGMTTAVKKWDFFSGTNEWDLGKYGGDDGTRYATNQSAWMAKSRLYKEVHKADGLTTDWVLDYLDRSDPSHPTDSIFKSVYDMEGDNADMIHETEGLIFKTESNMMGIYNEEAPSTSNAFHDRFIGFFGDTHLSLEDGHHRSLIIPLLKEGDRIVIKMGRYGNCDEGNPVAHLLIDGANDAMNNPITGEYVIGGSHELENGDKSKPYGEYHFIATGGSTTGSSKDFEMKVDDAKLLKIYSIEIYRNADNNNATILSENTILGENREILYTDRDGNATKQMDITLHHFGLGERGAYLSTSNSSYGTGSFMSTTPSFTPDANNLHFTYTPAHNMFGSFRARLGVKTKDANQSYVTDYADYSMAVGYRETKPYPYTWDFTDLKKYTLFSTNGDESAVSNTDLRVWSGYSMRVQPDGCDKGTLFVSGSQLYAGTTMFEETKGIGIDHYNNDSRRNGVMTMTGDENGENGGLKVNDSRADGGKPLFYGFIVPDVAANNAIYVRATKADGAPTSQAKYKIGSGTETAFTYTGTAGGDDIFAMQMASNASTADVKLCFQGYEVKKIAVATDAKTVNKYGWNTESREHPIDPSLLPYMTGKDFRTYIVTEANEENNTVTLARIDGGSANGDNANMKLIVPGATKVENEATVPYNGSINACIIRYVDDTVAEDAKEVNLFGDGSGFHLFVPDMHDAASTIPSNNLLKARVTATTDNDKVARDETVESKTFNNYAFTYKYRKVNDDGDPYTDQKEGVQAFYRIVSAGARSGGHQAYLSIKAPAASRASSRAAASSQSAEHYDILFQEWDNIEQMKGDVNGDGRFNKLDVNTMADYVAGRPAGIFKGLADMNDDGNIDIVDMTLMIKKITGE